MKVGGYQTVDRNASDIINDSNVSGASVSDALNTLDGALPGDPVHATFTGDGTTTVFDVGVALPDATQLIVALGGVTQTAGIDYSTSGSSVTYVTAPPVPQSGLDTPNIQIMGASPSTTLLAAGAIPTAILPWDHTRLPSVGTIYTLPNGTTWEDYYQIDFFARASSSTIVAFATGPAVLAPGNFDNTSWYVTISAGGVTLAYSSSTQVEVTNNVDSSYLYGITGWLKTSGAAGAQSDMINGGAF